MKIPKLFILTTVGIVFGVAMICDGYYGKLKIDEEINPVVSRRTTYTIALLFGLFSFLICFPILQDLPSYLGGGCASERATVVAGDNIDGWKHRSRYLDIKLQNGTELCVKVLDTGINTGEEITVRFLPLTKYAEVERIDTENESTNFGRLLIYVLSVVIMAFMVKHILKVIINGTKNHPKLFSVDSDARKYLDPIIKITVSIMVIFVAVFLLNFWHDYTSIFQEIFRYLYSLIIVIVCAIVIVISSKEVAAVRKNRQHPTK